MTPGETTNALLTLLEHSQQSEDLMAALKQAVELVQAIEQASTAEKAAIADFIEQGYRTINERLSTIQVIHGQDGLHGVDGQPGKNGKDGKDGRDGKPGANGSPDTPKQIAQKLNTLEEAIDPKVIKGFDKEVTSRITKHGGTNFVVSRGGVKYYDLPVDGSTKTFTLPAFWRVILVVGSSAPGVFLQGTDYTVSQANSQITFTSQISASTTLASGQTVTVIYAETN